jgi:hypothetical protein
MDLLALHSAVVTTDPSQSDPWRIEAFLSEHPLFIRAGKAKWCLPASALKHFSPRLRSLS